MTNKLFNYLKESYLNNTDNFILWLPVFFIFGVFLRFCFSTTNFVIFPIPIFLILISYKTKKYFLRFLSILAIITVVGFIRTDFHITKYKNPQLKYNLGRVRIYGNVESHREIRTIKNKITKKIVVSVDKITPLKNNPDFLNDENFKLPKKLLITLKNNNNEVNIGNITIDATVFPLTKKIFSSDFDTERYMYFKKIGGIGYKGIIVENNRNGNKIRLLQKIDIFRTNLAKEIINIKNSASMSIVAILLTGKKDFADKNAINDMNFSGLAHLLSISGLHMMTLIGIVLYITKWLLLRSERIALEHDVFKISAIVSLMVNFLYLILSGYSVSAIRAYIMSFILLFGIIIGRFNDSLRSISLVALITTFYKPDIIFNAGFQMSFMAVVALISSINYYFDYRENKDSNFIFGKKYLKIKEYFIISFITSLAVELATTPFSIYSFNNYSFYNIFANSFLTPIVSFIVLPLSILSIIFYPFGLSKITLISASYFMNIVLIVSKFITNIPNSVMFIQSPNKISMFLMIFGCFWFFIWKTSWRKIGLLLYLCGIATIYFQKKPDIVIDNTDKMISFVDNEQNIYVYNVKKYKINNIIRKLGANDYKEIRNINTCNGNKKNCTIIKLYKNYIYFYKNGEFININTNNFKLLNNHKINKMLIINKNSHNWYGS